MDLQRESTIAEAMRAQAARRAEAKKKRRNRKATEKPWQLLKESWIRFIRARYGRVIQLTPLGPPEVRLLRAMLGSSKMSTVEWTVDLDTATRMIELFIEQWEGEGLPNFHYFWKAKDTYKALAEGQIQPGVNDLNQDEYDENRDGSAPLIGW